MEQSKCEFFEVIDWDVDTNEIIHAVCTDHNPNWPNCNMCQGKWEYRDVIDKSLGYDPAVCKCCKSQASLEDGGMCQDCLDYAENIADDPISDIEKRRMV